MTYSAEVLADSPLAYWKLNDASGNAVDSSGNAHTATAFGTLTYGSTALVPGDTSVTFPGVSGTENQFYTGASASWMNVGTLSVEAWCSPAAITGVNQEIVLRDNLGSAGDACWRLRLGTANVIQWEVWTGASSVTVVNGSTALSAGNAYHVVGTYDGTTAKLYVNGALDGSQAISGSAYSGSSYGIRIGQLGSDANNHYIEPFDGRIGEVAFYGSALAGARIAAHYAAATGGSTPAAVPNFPASRVPILRAATR